MSDSLLEPASRGHSKICSFQTWRLTLCSKKKLNCHHFFWWHQRLNLVYFNYPITFALAKQWKQKLRQLKLRILKLNKEFKKKKKGRKMMKLYFKKEKKVVLWLLCRGRKLWWIVVFFERDKQMEREGERGKVPCYLFSFVFLFVSYAHISLDILFIHLHPFFFFHSLSPLSHFIVSPFLCFPFLFPPLQLLPL